MCRIGVIIPHLNQPEHLRKCLASLKDQSFDISRVEIIVVDNGSRELPRALCDEFGARLETEATPGPGPARNKGISVSSAPILAFIDADCFADRHWLLAITEAFKDPSVEVIGGDVQIGLVDPRRMTALEAYETVYAYRQKEYIERHGFSGTGNLAMQRPVFEIVGPFAGIDKSEDRDWGRRANAKGITILYRPE